MESSKGMGENLFSGCTETTNWRTFRWPCHFPSRPKFSKLGGKGPGARREGRHPDPWPAGSTPPGVLPGAYFGNLSSLPVAGAGKGCEGALEMFCSRPSRHHILELHNLERERPGENLKSRLKIFEVIVFSYLLRKLILCIQPPTGNRFPVSIHPGYVCMSLFNRNCFVNCAFSTYCIMNTVYQKYPSVKMTLNGHIKSH